MKLNIIYLSLLSVAAATGCYQTVHFVLPPEDTDVQDDAAPHDGQDLQDHDARPDAPDTAEAVDNGADPFHDPLHDDVGIDDGSDVDTADGNDALEEDAVADAADVEEGEIFEPYPAGDFTLTDYNADSPTYLQERTMSAAGGKVVVLFFLSYG
jgi:hypothetical protein